MQIQQMLLTPNKYSRPQKKLKSVTKIAVHYVGNPGTTAINNRNYFESLKDQIPDSTGKWWVNKDGTYRTYMGKRIEIRFVSAHLVIGLSGEVIQCIPLDEWSYCTNQANGYSISIECCHPDAGGKFTAATEQSLAELCAYLCDLYKLDPLDDIIRHYDVTGKQCPLYWAPTKYQPASVANARFEAFKNRVAYIMRCGETDKQPGGDMPAVPFKVRIIDDALNIRCKPGVSNKAVGVIRGGGVYTIVEVKQVGSALWGRLKSGIGWVNVGEKYCKMV